MTARFRIWLGVLALLAVLLAVAATTQPGQRAVSQAHSLWLRAVVPGPLSGPHAFLGEQCAACHEPLQGVQPRLCVACHAGSPDLVQRQPTAFHSDVQTCAGCHLEHRNGRRMPTVMDHGVLAEAGAQARERNAGNAPSMWRRTLAAKDTLQCATCHSGIDPHQEVFGPDCAGCHGLATWELPAFVHPSFRSTACSDCHLPPPSHTMEHFSMVSRRLSGQSAARVDQCYLCHDTTSWNDIRDKGRIKHH